MPDHECHYAIVGVELDTTLLHLGQPVAIIEAGHLRHDCLVPGCDAAIIRANDGADFATGYRTRAGAAAAAAAIPTVHAAAVAVVQFPSTAALERLGRAVRG